MTMNELIMKAREKKCSDIHISEGMPVSFRIHGQLLDSGFSFPAAETREMILSMLSDEQREQLENGDDVDFAIKPMNCPGGMLTIAASVSTFSGR